MHADQILLNAQIESDYQSQRILDTSFDKSLESKVEAIVENMTVEDYLDFFLSDSDLMEKVVRWGFNNGIFYPEFENELGDIEEQFFKENAYYEEENEEENTTD